MSGKTLYYKDCKKPHTSTLVLDVLVVSQHGVLVSPYVIFKVTVVFKVEYPLKIIGKQSAELLKTPPYIPRNLVSKPPDLLLTCLFYR